MQFGLLGAGSFVRLLRVIFANEIPHAPPAPLMPAVIEKPALHQLKIKRREAMEARDFSQPERNFPQFESVSPGIGQ